uniref:Uncharacterized protein n=1 Tax=Arundo donax TaxID=35708 RepID=A0A0A9AKZ7_ARUDO
MWPEVSMKLAVDTKAGRVLFAEADKDAVYFSLLTLPAMDKDLTVGSIGNLYHNFKKLDGNENNIAQFPPPTPSVPGAGFADGSVK